MLECTDAWIILVSKELIAFIAPSSSSTQERGEWQASVARKKSACLTEVSVAGRFYCKIPRNPGELSMRKQCVPGSFFSAHAQEPGNEAIQRSALCWLTIEWLLMSLSGCG